MIKTKNLQREHHEMMHKDQRRNISKSFHGIRLSNFYTIIFIAYSERVF